MLAERILLANFSFEPAARNPGLASTTDELGPMDDAELGIDADVTDNADEADEGTWFAPDPEFICPNV